MQLHDPWMLLLLGALPVLPWLERQLQRDAAVRFPAVGIVRAIDTAGRKRWRWLVPALRVLALAVTVVALARPQFGRAEGRFTGHGIDIMLAVDISGSMKAEDFTVGEKRSNRLQAVKSVVREFVSGRPNDRIGLVLFGARPYVQCPLTLDHGWLLANLDRAEIGMIEDGTAIGSALATAAARLKASEARSKVVILLTDGQNNAGKISPRTAADAAATVGIKVYTIGAGTRGMAPYPVRDLFGNTVYQPVQVDIDEETLTAIAQKTGGAYFRATDTESLQRIYADIDALERTDFVAPRYLEYDELYPWFLVPAMLLLALEVGLSQTVLRKLP